MVRALVGTRIIDYVGLISYKRFVIWKVVICTLTFGF